jgi:hypothetical protein
VGPIRRNILPTQRFVANDIQAIFRASEGKINVQLGKMNNKYKFSYFKLSKELLKMK